VRSVCHITLTTHSSQSNTYIDVQVRSSQDQVSTQCAWPHSMEDLRTQIANGKATKNAVQTTALTLGKVLMHEQAGQLIRTLLSATSRPTESNQSQETQSNETQSNKHQSNETQSINRFEPHLIIALHLPKEMINWPWELAMDPQNNSFLLHHGVELIRCIGPQNRQEPVEAKGYVVLGEHESFKFNAIKAATAQLNRRLKVQVKSIQNLSQMKEADQAGKALFYHLYAVDTKGVVSLDHQAQRLAETVCARKSYLLNISKTMKPSHHLRAREAGATLVFGRQIELSVKEKAESDRALYHALGSGYDVVSALHWARHVLLNNQPQHYHWSSLTLTVPPMNGDPQSHPAFNLLNQALPMSLPPLKSKNVKVEIVNQDQALQTTYAVNYTQAFFPAQSTQDFVNDTVKLIQKSRLPDHEAEKVALALRTSAMKYLSSLVKRGHEVPVGLTRSEQLTYQLIEAGRFNDENLPLVPSWFGYAQTVASRLGIQVDAVAQAIQALYINRSIWIHGGSAEQRLQFARSMSSEVFHSYPYEVSHRQALISSMSSSEVPLESQAFYKAVRMGWVDQMVDEFNEQATRPKIRQQLVAYHEVLDHWTVFKRAWIVTDGTHLHEEQINAVQHAMQEGVWQTYTEDHHAVRLYVPKDFRMIYLSEKPLDYEHSIINIELKTSPQNLTDVYKQHIRNEILPYLSSDQIENRLNQVSYLAFMQSVKGLEVLQLINREIALSSLKYALWNGGELAHCVESTELYIHPRIKTINPSLNALIFAYQDENTHNAEISWEDLNLPGQMILIAPYVLNK
jgi:hypothetical protein